VKAKNFCETVQLILKMTHLVHLIVVAHPWNFLMHSEVY